jgi:hypothetical protein
MSSTQEVRSRSSHWGLELGSYQADSAGLQSGPLPGVDLNQMWTFLDFFNFTFLVVLVYGAIKAGSR